MCTILNFRYRLERALESEDNSNDLVTIFMRNKSYSNIAYSVRRHAEAIQLVYICICNG